MYQENRGGRLIASVREAVGIKQGELARMTGQNIGNMSNIESGKRYFDAMPMDFFNRVTRALPHLSAVELLHAWGYEFEVPDCAFLPYEMVEVLRKLTPADLRMLETLARGLTALRRDGG